MAELCPIPSTLSRSILNRTFIYIYAETTEKSLETIHELSLVSEIVSAKMFGSCQWLYKQKVTSLRDREFNRTGVFQLVIKLDYALTPRNYNSGPPTIVVSQTTSEVCGY